MKSFRFYSIKFPNSLQEIYLNKEFKIKINDISERNAPLLSLTRIHDQHFLKKKKWSII